MGLTLVTLKRGRSATHVCTAWTLRDGTRSPNHMVAVGG